MTPDCHCQPTHLPPTCQSCGTTEPELIAYPNVDDMTSDTATDLAAGAVFQCLDVQACQRRQADIIRR